MPLGVGGPPAGRVPLEVGGPPARDFIGMRADQDTQDTQDPQDCGRVGFARDCGRVGFARDCGRVGFAQGHWPAQSHWDNGRLARCMDCPLPVNATRKMRVVPVSLSPARSARQALSWVSWVSWVSWPRRWSAKRPSACLANGPPPRWRLNAVAQERDPPMRRQDGGVPSQAALLFMASGPILARRGRTAGAGDFS